MRAFFMANEILKITEAELSSLKEQGLDGLYEYRGVKVCQVRALDLMFPEKRKKLEQELFESACAGFNRDQTDKFRRDVARHLREGTLYAAIQDGAAVGFAVMTDTPEVHGTYIAGIAKKPNAPSGIVESMVEYHLSRNGYEVVTVRTQNDRVVEIMTDVCDEVVPITREAGEKEMEILRQMKLLTEDVDASMVARRHYGGEPLIAGLPRRRSKNPDVVRTTDRINYEEGDALLAVGYRFKTTKNE
jgi:hypothetical protein